MNKRLMLLLAVLLTGCASAPTKGGHHTDPESSRKTSGKKRIPEDALAFDGPMPAVRTPPNVYTPPGAGGPTVGQPGYQGQGVPRSKDPRIVPGGTRGIYATGDGSRKVVHLFRPASADEEEWEKCEERVLDAMSSRTNLSPYYAGLLDQMNTRDWRCAGVTLMHACYIWEKSPTKDRIGFKTANDNHQDFVADMTERRKKECEGVGKDASIAITEMLSRASRTRWTNTAPTNAYEGLLPRSSAEPITTAPKRTLASITPTRAGQHAPDVTKDAEGAGIPQKALDACWNATQGCLNQIGELEAVADPVYYCVRWMGINRCALKAANVAHPAGPFARAMEAKWGKGWDEIKVMGFTGERIRKHCAEAGGLNAQVRDDYVSVLLKQCEGRYEAIFPIPPK